MVSEQLHVRQFQIIHDDLRDATIIVAGVGMLGSWTALAMARCARKVYIFDHDVVGEENLGTQAYNADQVGDSKVASLAEQGWGLPIIEWSTKFPIGLPLIEVLEEKPNHLVFISCVDSFQARKECAQWAWDNGVDLFVDTRAAAEICVVCLVPYEKLPQYIETLNTDEDAPDVACGLEGTAYVGMGVASRVASRVNAYFRGLPVPAKTVENLALAQMIMKEDME